MKKLLNASTIRSRILPPGWYPGDAPRVQAFLEIASGEPPPKPGAIAAIAPHAGWAYSGRIAARAFRSLKGGPDTVAVLGGHLPKGFPPLFALEDGVDTPLGPFMIDAELRDRLYRELEGREDRYQDNTVEVLLPMARYFFPNARLLWLRLPTETASLGAGEVLAKTAADLGRNILVLGSTDLTHYGDNYGFAPQGRGRKALDWVREVNDRRFIDAVLAGNGEAILQRAGEDRAACSAGAVLGALGFARAQGTVYPELLAHGTSAEGEREPPSSFVGYAALAWYH